MAVAPPEQPTTGDPMRVTDHLLWLQDASVRQMRSPNHGAALAPHFLIMHYTAGRSAESSAQWLCSPQAKASAHLVIGKDGQIIQLLPFNVVAWHAGASSWDDDGEHFAGMNQHAIGVELDNPGRVARQGSTWRSLALGTTYPDDEVIEATHKNETRPSGWCVYPSAQLDVAFEIAEFLVQHYGLKDIIGHDDVAPGRKSDPGPAFPMESFRGRLFGRSTDRDPSEFVATTSLNVRTGPGTANEALPVGPLPAGTRVRVVSTRDPWREVDVLEPVKGVNDVHGWVHGRYLRPANRDADGPANNPPAPAGAKAWTKAVLPEMTNWAKALLNDATSYPMFSETRRQFGDDWVLARVEWHGWTFRDGVKITGKFRGVTLYESTKV
jgi:N-acetylmuramoyl-L-alanine amidase